jgi:pimeloyl-ACP methyl ester carboxylesterase
MGAGTALLSKSGLILLAALAASAHASATEAISLTPCELRGSPGYGRIAAECGTLTVAEDPGQASGRQIALFVTRIKALKANPAPDAFTLINGGPGASSITLYTDLAPAFSAILLERDIIIVDQRGTGRSAPLECESDDQPPQSIGAEFDEARMREATRLCLDTLAADPRFYTTSLAVADLERVRVALGYRQLNIYGVSYGTRVAQHFARRHPDAVRTLVLDGVVTPDQALGPDIAINAQLALDAMVARCAADAACQQRFPHLPAQIRRLGERLRDQPVSLAIAHPVTARPTELTLTYGHFASTMRMLSYGPETSALLPIIIDEAAARDNYLPLALHALRIEEELGASINIAMHNAVVCTEDVPFYPDLEPLRQTLERTYLGTEQVRSLQALCEEWPRGIMDPDLRQRLDSDIPVLLLSGANDPVTPPAYADSAAAALRDSRHVIAPGQGHGIAARGCIPTLIGDFVRTADPQALDSQCVDRLGADPFFIDLMGPSP